MLLESLISEMALNDKKQNSASVVAKLNKKVNKVSKTCSFKRVRFKNKYSKKIK